MLTIVCSSQYPLDDFKSRIIKSSGIPSEKIQFLSYQNNNEFSLTEIYNKGLNEAIYNHIVYLHNDIDIETNRWGVKLLKQFEKHSDYGIIGVAGTKFMSDTGKWWEDKSKMYGRVAHTNNGKTWLSKYSEDVENGIEEVLAVDGVFFAIDKRKIKHSFDEDFKGFHFYDVSFSFSNHLSGVKVGVVTNIRINHKSIGMTNDSWEQNRIQFSELYKDVLPLKLKREITPKTKLKILIGCLNFSNYTGSELYVFELAKNLIKKGHEVSICSVIGNPLGRLASRLGIKLYDIKEPPGFKLGDGKWLLKTDNGDITSVKNTLYKVNDINFDIIHLNHKPVTEHLLRFYPNTPVICSIHSEVIALEEPVISNQIKKYIAIRPEIKEKLINEFDIKSEDISVIYNPIDENKFKINKTPTNRNKKRVLFVGTIDYLRQKSIEDLINQTKIENQELWIVGKKNDNYLEEMLTNNLHVKYFEPVIDIEKFIHQCDYVAGILLGRTTIEGWMCGKPAWIYDVDSSGEIIDKKLVGVPDDIDKFMSSNVCNQILSEYTNIYE